MDISGRIHARKILLVYWYEQYFLELSGKKESLLVDIEKIQTDLERAGDDDEVVLSDVMNASYYSETDEELAYIITHHFPQLDSSAVDYTYLDTLAGLFFDYLPQVSKAVNEFTVSFSFEQMDIVDRVIFVLGYIEFLLVDTPKEIMINEMIELAKRYGDDKSAKLINGIGHKVLTALAKKNTTE